MFDTREKPSKVETAFLIGAYFDRSDEDVARSLLNELGELVSTLGIAVLAKECIFIRTRSKRYFTGSGKAVEMMETASSSTTNLLPPSSAPGKTRATSP